MQRSARFSQKSAANSGQALVIILLVLSIASTLVLSLVSRTVTDIAVTTKERESSRAFSAAEAGIEEQLSGVVTSGSVQLAPGVSYETKSSVLGEGASDFASPQELSAGDTFPVWFVSHAADGSLTCSDQPCFTGTSMKVCWGRSATPGGDTTTPAVAVSIFYKNDPGQDGYSSMRIARAAFDPNAGRRAVNNFTAPDGSGCTIGDKSYAFATTITFSNLGIPSNVYNTKQGLQTARIRLLYNSNVTQPVGVNVFGGSLPAQGATIESTGKADEATRKIQVFNLFSDLPPIFDFTAFSSGNLVK